MFTMIKAKLGRYFLPVLILALVAALCFTILFAWFCIRYQTVLNHEGELTGKYFSYNGGILNAASYAVSGFPPELYISEDMIYTTLNADPAVSRSLRPIVLTPCNFEWLFRSQDLRSHGPQFTAADLREYRLHAVAAWRAKTENGYVFFLLMDNSDYLISIFIATDPDYWRSSYNQNVVISSYFETPEEFLPKD